MMNMNDLRVDEMKIEALPCRGFLTAVIEVSFGFCCAYFLFVGFRIGHGPATSRQRLLRNCDIVQIDQFD